jgi:hypothetical protein
MLSIEVCKKVLNKKNKKYSNEEVKLIRDHLYKMVLLIDEVKDKKNDQSKWKECNSLQASKYN